MRKRNRLAYWLSFVARGIMLCVLLVPAALPAVAADETPPAELSIPAVPDDVIAIVGHEPFVRLFEYETRARADDALAFIKALAARVEAIAGEFAAIGIGSNLADPLPPIEQAPADETTDPLADPEAFYSRVNGLLAQQTSVKTPEEAMALDAEINGAFDKWAAAFAAGIGDVNDNWFENSLRGMSAEGITIEFPDFGADIAALEDILAGIGSAATVDEARQQVNRFYQEAQALQTQAGDIAASLETDVTTAFNQWAQAYQARLATVLQSRGEAMGQTVMLQMAYEARNEANAAKNEIIARITAEIQEMMQGRVGPDQQLTEEEIATLMMEGFQIGMSRGAAEGAKVRQEMEPRYMARAEEERARITSQMNEEAAWAEAQLRERLGSLGNSFTSLQEDAQQARNSYAEREKWEQQAAYQRRAIFEQVIDARLAEAEELIVSNRAEIDLAYSEGRIDVNTDDLLAQLRGDRESLVDAFMSAGDDMAAVAAVEARYRQSWKTIQENLERAKAQGTTEVLNMIKQQMPAYLTTSYLDTKIKSVETLVTDFEAGGWQGYYQFDKECFIKRFAPYHEKLFPALKTAYGNYADSLRELRAAVATYEAMKKKPADYSITDVLAMKNALVAGNAAVKAAYPAYWQAGTTYWNMIVTQRSYCWSQSK